MTVGFQLTARKVAAIKATGKKQVFTDGNGLRLVVERDGGKRWLLRRMLEGKDKEFGLGGYPAVSLDDARGKAAALRAGSELPATGNRAASPFAPLSPAALPLRKRPASISKCTKALGRPGPARPTG
jgi:hypothetical protein